MNERDDELMGNIPINEYQEVAEGYDVQESTAVALLRWGIDNAKENVQISKKNLQQQLDDETHFLTDEQRQAFQAEIDALPDDKPAENAARICHIWINKIGNLTIGCRDDVAGKFVNCYVTPAEWFQLCPSKKIVQATYKTTPQGRTVQTGYEFIPEELINSQLKGYSVVYSVIDGKNKILEVF